MIRHVDRKKEGSTNIETENGGLWKIVHYGFLKYT